MIYNNPNQVNQVSPKGRILALDLGTKRIGIAISDASRFIATPKLVLNRQSNQKDFLKIWQLFQEYEAVTIVIGMPLNMNGMRNEMSEFVDKFTKNFDEFLEGKISIFLFDERLSSFEAKEIAASELSRKNNEFIDDIAASVILQHFLDEIKSE